MCGIVQPESIPQVASSTATHAAACMGMCLCFTVLSSMIPVMHAYISQTQYKVDYIVTITADLATLFSLARQCHSIANV